MKKRMTNGGCKLNRKGEDKNICSCNKAEIGPKKRCGVQGGGDVKLRGILL